VAAAPRRNERRRRRRARYALTSRYARPTYIYIYIYIYNIIILLFLLLLYVHENRDHDDDHFENEAVRLSFSVDRFAIDWSNPIQAYIRAYYTYVCEYLYLPVSAKATFEIICKSVCMCVCVFVYICASYLRGTYICV